jgi:transcriptional regulator with XRE-family HTH domain
LPRSWDSRKEKMREKPEKIVERLGDRLKRLRQEAGLSLKEFGQLAGVAPSTVQKIENGKMVPSILILMKISRGLNRSLNYFLEDSEEPAEVRLVRWEDRKKSSNPEIGAIIESIARPLRDPLMDAYILRIEPGGEVRGGPLSHAGEELVYCYRGKVEFLIGGERYVLRRKDTLHFKASIPHQWRNLSSRESVLIMVNSPPWFS